MSDLTTTERRQALETALADLDALRTLRAVGARLAADGIKGERCCVGCCPLAAWLTKACEFHVEVGCYETWFFAAGPAWKMEFVRLPALLVRFRDAFDRGWFGELRAA